MRPDPPAGRRPTLEEVIATVRADLYGHVGVGLVVGVLHAGEERFLSLGNAQPTGIPPTADTVFALGLVTKPFTATAAMRLVAAGELDLESPIRTWLPGLRLSDEAATSSLTLHHLLTHSAGWPGDWFLAFDPGIEDTPLSLEEQVERLGEVPLLTAPGSVYSYSNLALIVTGRLIEVVTGRLYEDAVRDLVLSPFGMSRSGYTAQAEVLGEMTPGYVASDGSWKTAAGVPTSGPVPRIHNPSGGLLSTARDMLKFLRPFVDGGGTPPGFGEEVASVMLTPQLPSVGPRKMGLGWSILQTDPLVFRHGGGMAGFVATCAGCAESGTAVVVLANWENSDEAVVTAEADVMGAFAGARYRYTPGEAAPAQRLDSYAGSYRLPTGRRYDIDVAGTRLLLYGGDAAPGRTWDAAEFGKQRVGLVEDNWGVIESNGAVSPLVGFEIDDGRVTAANVGGRWLPRTTWLRESPAERIELDGHHLRFWREDDGPALAEALAGSIDHIRPWMPFFTRDAFGREEQYVRTWVAAARDGRGFGHGLFKSDGRLIGATSVRVQRDRPGTFDLGYWIHVEFAARGLGRAAAQAVADSMLALPDVRRMEIECDERNLASAAIARSLGCILEGTETADGGGRVMRWALGRGAQVCE